MFKNKLNLIVCTGLSVMVICGSSFFLSRHRRDNDDLKLNGDGFSLQMNSRAGATPGTYFLGLADVSKMTSLPLSSHLLAFRSDGQIVFQRTFVNSLRQMIPVNFRPLKNQGYAFFLGFSQETGFPGVFKNFDSEFRDSISRVVPDRDTELDSHDFAEGQKGSIFFLFERQRGITLESEIQEWDPSGQVLFAWSPHDWIVDRDHPKKVGVNDLEINSIDIASDGNLIVSFRETNEIIKIEYPSGKTLWRLSKMGGWRFVNDPLDGFYLQHCVRQLKNGNLLLFDNGTGDVDRPVRAVEYQIDESQHTATLVWEFRSPRRFSHHVVAGSVQRLSNGNTLIGWGGPENAFTEKPANIEPMPIFTEVNHGGEIVREAIGREPLASYRTVFRED